jgi:HlyD family secretion protein
MKTILLVAAAATLLADDEPAVPRASILIATVKRGDLTRTVDGYGKLVRKGNAVEGLIDLPSGTNEVRAGESVLVDVRSGLFHGTVKAIDAAGGGKQAVVMIDGSTAKLSGGETVAASIQVEKLPNILTLERVGLVVAEQNLVLYRLNGEFADRVEVQTGRMNTREVEIRSGLAEGDRVIVTEMKTANDQPRVKLQ